MTRHLAALLGESGRLYRFGLVGIAATGVHLAVAWLVLSVWPGASEFGANALAFSAAFPVSLLGHRWFTFRVQGSAQRFFVVAMLGFAANNGLLATLLAFTQVDGVGAIGIAVFLVPVMTYVASRLWAFRAIS